MSYASGTSVSIERSKAEIERMLRRYGCSEFGSGWANHDGAQFAHVTFRHGEARIMLGLPMPPLKDFATTPAGRVRRSVEAREVAYDAECRRRWRALLLIIKAKLEAVASGITSLEHEFLGNMVLPNGTTFGDWAVPQLQQIQSGMLMLPERAEVR